MTGLAGRRFRRTAHSLVAFRCNEVIRAHFGLVIERAPSYGRSGSLGGNRHVMLAGYRSRVVKPSVGDCDVMALRAASGRSPALPIPQIHAFPAKL